MEKFNNPAVLWFLAGFIFFLLEFAIPGFILFFFGAGAWIVAIICLFADISLNTQLIIFMVAALSTLVLFRKTMKNLILVKRKTSEIEDELIGKTARAETSIAPGQNGKVYFKGASWDAASDETITPGQNVIIVGNDSILLIVKPA